MRIETSGTRRLLVEAGGDDVPPAVFGSGRGHLNCIAGVLTRGGPGGSARARELLLARSLRIARTPAGGFGHRPNGLPTRPKRPAVDEKLQSCHTSTADTRAFRW